MLASAPDEFFLPMMTGKTPIVFSISLSSAGPRMTTTLGPFISIDMADEIVHTGLAEVPEPGQVVEL